jgi:hypothetical protein
MAARLRSHPEEGGPHGSSMMSDCQQKARHPEEGGEWRLAALKREVNGEVL